MSFLKVPISRAPLWLAYKIPPVKWVAQGISKAIEVLDPSNRYISGITMQSYFAYQNIKRRLVEPKVRICVPYTAKDGQVSKYTAIVRVDASSPPKEIAGLVRSLRQSIKGYVEAYGDPHYYVQDLLPALVDLSLQMPSLKFKQLEEETGKLIANYAQEYQDISVPVFVKGLALMLKPAREKIADLLRKGRIDRLEIFAKFIKVLGTQCREALKVPEYYKSKDKDKKDKSAIAYYLGRIFIDLIHNNKIESAADFRSWAKELAKRTNGFSQKCKGGNPSFLYLVNKANVQ